MDILTLVASGLGVGRIPWAPGTFGTLLAVPAVWGLSLLPSATQAALLVLAVPAAAAVCGHAARTADDPDPPWVVIDEMVGYWIAVALLPGTPAVLAAGFVCFRLFDILKPPPIRWIDRAVGGGWGVLLDDVAAGLAARAVLAVMHHAGMI